MKKLWIWFSLTMLVAYLACCSVHISADSSDTKRKTEKELRAYVNENNTWAICYQQGVRTSDYIQCDATSEYLYFTYMEHNCVDVYDMNGEFLYSFLFPDRQNGVIYIRCEDDHVYISTKSKILYIFKGTEELDHMDHDEASEKGYNFNWFYKHKPYITVDNQWISCSDTDGVVFKQIPTPYMVKRTIPTSIYGWEIIVKPCIAVLLFLALAYCIAFCKKQ